MEKLIEELSKESIEKPPNLQGIDRRRLECASEKVDRVLQHVTLRMVAGLVGEKRNEQIKREDHVGKDAFTGK